MAVGRLLFSEFLGIVATCKWPYHKARDARRWTRWRRFEPRHLLCSSTSIHCAGHASGPNHLSDDFGCSNQEDCERLWAPPAQGRWDHGYLFFVSVLFHWFQLSISGDANALFHEISDLVQDEEYNKALRDPSSKVALEMLDSTLRSILEDVRLVYLLDREGGWDTTANWEDMLSLGEQQRLGMVSLKESLLLVGRMRPSLLLNYVCIYCLLPVYLWMHCKVDVVAVLPLYWSNRLRLCPYDCICIIFSAQSVLHTLPAYISIVEHRIHLQWLWSTYHALQYDCERCLTWFFVTSGSFVLSSPPLWYFGRVHQVSYLLLSGGFFFSWDPTMTGCYCSKDSLYLYDDSIFHRETRRADMHVWCLIWL